VSDENAGVSIPIPLPEDQVFRYGAMDDILTLLYRNPHQEFTVSQLREVTGHGGKTVNNSIQILADLNLVGVLVFGSVGRGDADRVSDIDIQPIVKEDLVKSRRIIQDVRQEIEDRKFDGERYELQVLVESVETAENYGEKLHEIFSEAVAVYSTEKPEELQKSILS